MSKTSAPAAATCLPQIDRRRLLMGLAAASTAAAVGVNAVTAAPVENPQLVRLGDELPAIEAAYCSALKHQNDVANEWAPQRPVAPAELTAEPREAAKLERDFYGAHHDRQIRYSGYIKYNVDRARSALKSKATKNPWHSYWTREEWELELADKLRLYAIAVRYEAECEWITKAANYEACWKKVKETTTALASHITEIMKQPETTMAGVLIKAEALAAWGRVDEHDQWWAVFEPHQWHGQIAASILRHAQGGVS